ncbi:hypothetical protein BJ170DRAFT_597832 [Xylariales sp. AK1849]|nr:hypothetical protein BJ170DRAFT_597832 [Xylariales sp. AK1849]
MNKNWGDRADKDLFFTILSVKNIGVISGGEWTTIGNHMRTLGYGFTNEGCRQHFQGLRRAQHKADSNGSLSDSNRKADPTTNPITRRPGPGRGRPRKQPPAPMAQSGEDETAVEGQQGPLEPDDDDHIPVGVSVSMSVPVDDPASTLAFMSGEADLEEQPAKRQRLDDVADQMDDAAVLGLAVDGNADAVAHHGLPEYFHEA